MAQNGMKTFGEHQSGFSLVEVVLALGIIAFAIIPLFGLMSVGLKTNKVSAEELGAITLFSEICYDLEKSYDANGNAVTVSNRYGLKMPLQQSTTITDRRLFCANGNIISGTSSSAIATARSQTGETIYSVSLRYIPSGQYVSTANNQPALVAVTITWPATTDSSVQPEGSWQNVAAFPQQQAQFQSQ
jgi:uncharacterized protein (TIGR02598 family)